MSYFTCTVGSHQLFSIASRHPHLFSHPPSRRRVGVFSKSSPPPPPIHAFGILGIVGPLDERNSGWVVTDFGAWAFLISQVKGYSAECSTWNMMRPVRPLFPDDSVVLGEAGCDRLVLPLPFPSEADVDAEISAVVFKTKCLLSLRSAALNVKRGETIVLLLVGHGSSGPNGFLFNITTQPNTGDGEASITKGELELVLEVCQGEILVICNSCQSGDLVSDR